MMTQLRLRLSPILTATFWMLVASCAPIYKAGQCIRSFGDENGYVHAKIHQDGHPGDADAALDFNSGALPQQFSGPRNVDSRAIETVFGDASWGRRELKASIPKTIRGFVDEAGVRELASPNDLSVQFCDNCGERADIRIDVACTEKSISMPLCAGAFVRHVELAGGHFYDYYLGNRYLYPYFAELAGREFLYLNPQNTSSSVMYVVFSSDHTRIEQFICVVDPAQKSERLHRTVDACFSRAIGGYNIFSRNPASNFYLGANKLEGDRQERWTITATESKECGAPSPPESQTAQTRLPELRSHQEGCPLSGLSSAENAVCLNFERNTNYRRLDREELLRSLPLREKDPPYVGGDWRDKTWFKCDGTYKTIGPQGNSGTYEFTDVGYCTYTDARRKKVCHIRYQSKGGDIVEVSGYGEVGSSPHRLVEVESGPHLDSCKTKWR